MNPASAYPTVPVSNPTDASNPVGPSTPVTMTVQPQPINPAYQPQPMDPAAAGQPQNGMYQPQPYVVQANPVYPGAPSGAPSQFVVMPNAANRPMDIDSNLNCLFVWRWIILVLCILDLIFGVSFFILVFVFIICGFVYVCTFSFPLIVIYTIHRYLSTVLCFIAAAAGAETSSMYLIFGFVNIAMTIVETFAFVCAVKVNKKYNNNDIRRLSH
ncbi:hypothetical protein WA577_006588, partial [Blastocystis sp. JDR]